MDREPDSEAGLGVSDPVGSLRDAEPLGRLPRLSSAQVRLERWMGAWTRDGRLPSFLDGMGDQAGGAIVIERPEVLWRASGLRRAGLIAQLTAPRLATRLALGIENSLAHALVDRLLGFDRSFAERRLQLTPVEWGVWTFLILRAVDSLDSSGAPDPSRHPGDKSPLCALDLTLDRVGPDPFEPAGLGSIITIRWPVHVADVAGAVRLWLPESVVDLWLDSPRAPAGGGSIQRGTSLLPVVSHGLEGHATDKGTNRRTSLGELASLWRAEAGFVSMPQGLRRLRVGGVLPLADSRLTGSPASPSGTVHLVLDLYGPDGRFRVPAAPVADSGGRLLRLEDSLLREPWPRDPIQTTVKESRTMNRPSAAPNPSSSAPEVNPLDVPVTLTVELGRVNLTLSRLADLKPGDVVELSRHSRAPVELTSNGRLVARGELILIDADLGVRVTCVFL
jgi:type III secretion system YscQ/HrcQ family protein